MTDNLIHYRPLNFLLLISAIHDIARPAGPWYFNFPHDIRHWIAASRCSSQ